MVFDIFGTTANDTLTGTSDRELIAPYLITRPQQSRLDGFSRF